MDLILRETFAIRPNSFIVERAVRDERVVRKRKFRARDGIEVEYVQRLFYGLDDDRILLGKRLRKNIFDPAGRKTCVRQNWTRSQKTQKRAAIGQLSGRRHSHRPEFPF